jgi:hypothetical protein
MPAVLGEGLFIEENSSDFKAGAMKNSSGFLISLNQCDELMKAKVGR